MSKREIANKLHKPARKNYTRRRVNVYGKRSMAGRLGRNDTIFKTKQGLQVYFVRHRLFYKVCLGHRIKI